MDNAIKAIDRDSPLAGKVRPGDTLLAINSNKILDVLDYKFFAYDTRLELRLRRPDGSVAAIFDGAPAASTASTW